MDIHDGSVESAWLSTNMCTVVGIILAIYVDPVKWLMFKMVLVSWVPPTQIYIISELWNTIFISYSYKESIMSQQTLKKTPWQSTNVGPCKILQIL